MEPGPQVLKNGVEVKLQRNALSVLEPPTGNEEDEDYEFDYSSSGSDTGERGNDFSNGMEFSKVSKPKVRYTRPWAPSTSAKSMSRSICKVSQSVIHTSHPKVNLAKLGSNTLWRYWSTFNLGRTHPNPSKEQLVKAIQQHFASQQVNEVDVILELIHLAKRQKCGDNRRN